jgi:hypothetical protein
MHDSTTCPNCVSWQAQFHRSEEKRIRDAVTYQVKLASLKHNVPPKAEEDLIARVLNLGEWKENKAGRIVLHKGGLVVHTKDGYSEMTPDGAVVDLKPVAPHLYGVEETQKNGDAGPNPFMKGAGFNMTRQAEILRADPARAKRLAAEAGIELAI